MKNGFIFAICLLAIIFTGAGCAKYQPISGPSNVDFTLNLNDASNSALRNNSSSLITNGLIIIRDGQGNFFALQQSCSYKQCTLTYLASNNNLQCTCHGCIFSDNGYTLQGPATVTLKTYKISKTNNFLHITS